MALHPRILLRICGVIFECFGWLLMLVVGPAILFLEGDVGRFGPVVFWSGFILVTLLLTVSRRFLWRLSLNEPKHSGFEVLPPK